VKRSEEIECRMPALWQITHDDGDDDYDDDDDVHLRLNASYWCVHLFKCLSIYCVLVSMYGYS